MAYDPADLKLPHWLLAALDGLVRLQLPVWPGWQVGVTRPGAVYAAAMLGVIAAAFYSGNNLLYLCAAMLVSLAATAILTGVRMLQIAPDISAFMPGTATADTVVVARYPVETSCSMPGDILAAWQGEDTNPECHLRLAKDGMLFMRLPAPHRGLFCFSSLVLTTEAPLGLWRLERRGGDRKWMWAVLPEPVSLEEAHVSGLSNIEGEEWHDLRTYVAGDMPSRIHWRKSSSGIGEPYTTAASGWVVKRFVQPGHSDKHELLRVDLRGRSGPAFEHMLGQVVSWIRTHPQGRLILGRREFDLDKEHERRLAWQALAAVTPESQPPAGEGGMVLSAMREDYAF